MSQLASVKSQVLLEFPFQVRLLPLCTSFSLPDSEVESHVKPGTAGRFDSFTMEVNPLITVYVLIPALGIPRLFTFTTKPG